MKKLLAFMLCLVMTVVVALPSFASELSPGAANGDVISEKKTVNQQLNDFLTRTDKTQVQKNEAVQKVEILDKILSGETIPQKRYVANTLPLSFYSQENGYYCGPATTKQTVQYLKGSSPTQSQLATSLGTTSGSGTDTNRIATYLNNNTSKSYSVLWSWPNAAALSQMVITDIDNAQPIVAHVIIGSTSTGWPYTTSGHYMNYNGYGATGNIINVTDPFADRYGYSTGKYGVSNGAAEAVTDRIVW